jgi:hypothetical protein
MDPLKQWIENGQWQLILRSMFGCRQIQGEQEAQSLTPETSILMIQRGHYFFIFNACARVQVSAPQFNRKN